MGASSRSHSFFFNDTATTEIYTLTLHDALPISASRWAGIGASMGLFSPISGTGVADRKSTRLNSSHVEISYAVFCLKKTTQNKTQQETLMRWSRGRRARSVPLAS